MIIVQLTGGLGNQMFQYAAGRSLSLARKVQLKLDLSLLVGPARRLADERSFALDCFNVSAPAAQTEEIDRLIHPFGHGTIGRAHAAIQRMMPLHKRRFYDFELAGVYDCRFPGAGSHAYLRGYWQSEKYFSGHAHQVRQDVEFRESPTGPNAQFADSMTTSESVSVHVRRGDYVSNPLYNRRHGTCDETYYLNAIELIRSRLSKPVFYVFSDDVPWCKANLKLPGTAQFIEHNHGDRSYEDMRLMSLCKHNIIANSSFSWWGAWLNQNPEKIVVAPRKWFRDLSMPTRDLVPEGWIRV